MGNGSGGRQMVGAPLHFGQRGGCASAGLRPDLMRRLVLKHFKGSLAPFSHTAVSVFKGYIFRVYDHEPGLQGRASPSMVGHGQA